MRNQEIIEYDRRQISLMEYRIMFYRKKQIGIDQFRRDISDLSWWVQNAPDKWRQTITYFADQIDEIYSWSYTTDRDPTLEELQKILQLVDKIEEQVVWYKKNYLPPIDDENY